MGVMLFPSFVLGNASGEGGTFLVPLSLFSILLSLPLLSSLSPSPSFSLPSFLLFFFTSHSPFFLSFRTNSFHPFFFSYPIFHLSVLFLLFSTSLLFFSLFSSRFLFFLSFRTNSFHPFFLLLLFSTSMFFFSSFPPLCSSSLYFHLVFLSSFLLKGGFFLRELLVLCTSEVYWMTLLIVIECNLIGIKSDFSFFDHELSHSVVCNFPEHSMSELLETSKITCKRSNRHLKIDNASFKITN